MVVLGSWLNRAIGTPIFVPLTIVTTASILAVIFTPLKLDETCAALADGSRFILTTLFSVGIFLGFINIIAVTGVFEQLAELVGNVPSAIIVPAAMILAFLIAIPAGAFSTGVLTLILPTLAVLGMPPIAMGFIAVAIGFGTQISPVQINVAALSNSFNKDIPWIVKNNVKFMVPALALLIIMAVIFV